MVLQEWSWKACRGVKGTGLTCILSVGEEGVKTRATKSYSSRRRTNSLSSLLDEL